MARMPHAHELPITIHPGGQAQRSQIVDQVLELIRAGALRPGDPLPSSRALAQQLGLSRGVVVAAFDELIGAGAMTATPGCGTFVTQSVAPDTIAAQATSPPRALAPLVAPTAHEVPPLHGSSSLINARPGYPDVALIDPVWWRRAWRAAAVAPVSAEYVPAHAELRTELVQHLRRQRQVVASVDDVHVFGSVRDALVTVAHALNWRGRAVAVEDPGYTTGITGLQHAGVDTRPVPVDVDGLDPNLLTANDIAACVTPAHQYPLGYRLSPQRRVQLLQWARDSGGVIVEDDYDGEFRYDVPPLPAIAALPGASEHVVYIGTASKVLTPSLRVAWVVAPFRYRAALRDAQHELRHVVDPLRGLAFAHLLHDGGVARHVARATRVYRDRRALVSDLASRELPSWELLGLDAGLHVALRRNDIDDVAAASALAEQGYDIPALSEYCDRTDHRGLLLGYGQLNRRQIADIITAIARNVV